MPGINIYQASNYSSEIYTLVYNIDNIQRLNLNKNTGVLPFSLPIVEGTSEMSGRMIRENTEYVHVNGVEAKLTLSFEIGLNNINTMLGFVSNRLSHKNKIDVIDWAGETSGYTFIGIVDSVDITQNGGEIRPNCTLTFVEGSNVLDNMGF